MINSILCVVLFLDLNFIVMNNCMNDMSKFRKFEQRMFFEKNLKLLHNDLELAFVMNVFNDKDAKIQSIKVRKGNIESFVFVYVKGDEVFRVETRDQSMIVNGKEFFICCYEDVCVKLNEILGTKWDVFEAWKE